MLKRSRYVRHILIHHRHLHHRGIPTEQQHARSHLVTLRDKTGNIDTHTSEYNAVVATLRTKHKIPHDFRLGPCGEQSPKIAETFISSSAQVFRTSPHAEIEKLDRKSVV